MNREPPNPGLHVAGYGDIGVPISTRVAKDIFQHLHQNHPAAVRDGVALIQEDRLTFLNFRWRETTNRAFTSLTGRLGLDQHYRLLRPYLLLSEPGVDPTSFMEQCCAQTFAMLMITLPTAHSGTTFSFTAGEISISCSLNRDDQLQVWRLSGICLPWTLCTHRNKHILLP